MQIKFKQERLKYAFITFRNINNK